MTEYGTSLTPLLLFCFCVSLWLIWRKQKMSILERHGIHGPKPDFFSGNFKDYESMPNVLWDSMLTKKYGQICGYYLGAKPVVLVGNAELLCQIQRSRDFQKFFLERPRRVPGGINPDPLRAKMLGNLPVAEWQHLRRKIAPTFNTVHLREMTNDVVVLIDKMVASIPVGKEVDLYEKFKCVTLDIIGKTGFGLDTNILENPNDPFMSAVAAEFTKSTSALLVRSRLYFPEFSWIIRLYQIGSQNVHDWLGWTEPSPLWNQGRMAVQQRLQRQLASGENKGPQDLLQHLLSSNLTVDDIVANCVLFFEAAYETMSSGLAFTLHLLVNHIGVQEEIRKELMEYIEEFGEFDSRVLHELPYMDSVIKESLRLFPPQTTFIGRASEVDFVYRNSDGIPICTIPKGTHIQAALFQMHHCDAWEDPEAFIPDRFLDKDLKLDHYQPFGIGRRECIGKKFATLVLKLALAKLCTRFHFQPSERTEKFGTIAIHYKTATMSPENGCWAETTAAAAA